MAGRKRAGVPEWVEPMLATGDRGRIPAGPEWAYEYKVDGYRACMRVAPGGATVLTSRNGIDFTAEFAGLAGVFGDAPGGADAVLDGEVVAYDENGKVDFSALQERRGRYQSHQSSIRRDEPFDDVPVSFLAFDLLRYDGRSLLTAPYDERRALLEALPLPDPYRISVVRAFTWTELDADHRTPEDLLEHVAATAREGLMAKLRTGAYHPGRRTDLWRKHPLTHTTEVIICGYRPGQGRIAGLMGGLLLGAHDPATGDLVYLGDVGTGFTEAERARMKERLAPLERRRHPFAVAPPREDVARAQWVEPRLVGEVEYRQFTRGAGRVRHTAWRGLREDRSPDEVLTPGATDPQPVSGKKITVQAGKRRLQLSNLDKPLYPDGFTKGEVIHYYSRIADVLLPHLAGRPVTFLRYPDGVGGGRFFGKNVPSGAPSWLPTVTLPRHRSRETVTYPLLDELAALVWAANLAALELHVPQWTVDAEGKPAVADLLVFDLDPGPGTTIVDCCRVAERLHDALAEDGLTAFAKTSGSKGMQLYAAITTGDPGAPSAYAKALAERLAGETPDAVTAVMAKAKRTGRVFIDWSQNNPAKTTIAPYSLRGRDLPTVSTPITWDEVRAGTDAEALVFTADDVLDRVDELGDLFAGLGTNRAPLP